MVGPLLLRGMLVGLLAGLLSFGFLKVFGEPQVERAIAFESQAEASPHHHADEAAVAVAPDEPEPELVSRPVQAGIGLLTGIAVYCAAFGGLFAIAFAFAEGRVGALGPRANALLLAGIGFVAVSLVPALKYPANPPSVGQAGTIGERTSLYFALIALSLAAAIGAVVLGRRLVARWGGWNGVLAAACTYALVMGILGLVLPVVDEVPEAFPASVLWQFRVASLGAQLILWATLGLVFGLLAERLMRPRPALYGLAAARR